VFDVELLDVKAAPKADPKSAEKPAEAEAAPKANLARVQQVYRTVA
jgi:FKBP-type peptidyl-prolyl cis-trans isomerase FkpA